MEAAESTTNSSKVIVQCHDPSNLFDKVVPLLEPRLPLSKLHWKAPNRPLRSIDQLNVSFVRGDAKSETTANARRHQIPGLRQTPFVKVFLVRCDDRELYKDTCRKEVKQWLKSQGISQDGKTLMKGQERHDAYEYIILHVVLPGTPAAAAPKSSKHISVEASESTDSLNSKTKWPGKGQSTVFDKLRADFGSAKAPFERIAQVRLIDPENRQTNGLGQSEIEEQWQDFIEKLKTAILLSFDARVTQYEEDIRDREAQRQLPGWNFCTFFILKEGLARGFENVGLIEDALTVYDELDAGLDLIVQEQASRTEPDPTSALLPFSNDLKPAIRDALDNVKDVEDNEKAILSSLDVQILIDVERQDFPFDAEKRNYQQRILTNQVSALDFHIYIFTRQLQLLFRRAKLSSPTSKSKHAAVTIPKAQYDLNVTAEICEKAASFITFASRALRRDFYAAWGGQQGLNEDELRTQQIVVGSLVASWKWSALMQMLCDCQVLFFLRDILVDPQASSGNAVNGHRTSHGSSANGAAKSVNEGLVVWAGELMSMSRNVLQDTVLTDIDGVSKDEIAKGLHSQSLRLLSKSKDTASDMFKLLTIQAYQCFKAADRINASHSMLHALATMELEDDRIDEAIWWLEHVPDLSSLHARTATDRTLLRLYARCLKMQQRYDEYVRTLIGLLISMVVNPYARALPRFDEQSQKIFDELVEVAELVSDIDLTLGGFISIQDLPKSILHGNNGTSFVLDLGLSLRFNASIRVSHIELVLSAIERAEPEQIVVRSTEAVTLTGSSTKVRLVSNIITEGWYDLAQLTLRIGNIAFVHDFRNTTTLSEEIEKVPISSKPFPVMIYPHSHGLRITAKPSPVVDLTQPSRVTVEIVNGLTEIDDCLILLRPATAGVRLDVQEMHYLDQHDPNSSSTIQQEDLNTVIVKTLGKNSRVVFEIPYSTETTSTVIGVKIQAECRSQGQTFSVYLERSVMVNLPLGINVQDIYQAGRMFSRFTASPSTFIPVRILKWSAEEGQGFAVKPTSVLDDIADVFAKMSASWIIEAIPLQYESPKLPLAVQYQSYDDLILGTIEAQFRRDVSTCPADFVSELLLSHLLRQIPLVWMEHELETAVLSQEFEMFDYDALDWSDTLKALSLELRKGVEDWLRSWHAQHQYLSLEFTHAPIREIRLSVDLPKPSLTVSTCLNLHLHHKGYLAIGQPVFAELVIQSCCASEVEAAIQFEVASQPDLWLIGGKKRGCINTSASDSTFSIIVIAQKTGHLLLPTIDIKVRSWNGHADASDIHVEVESKSLAKSVLVVPYLQSTTIAVGVDGMAGKHWAVESRRRLETS